MQLARLWSLVLAFGLVGCSGATGGEPRPRALHGEEATPEPAPVVNPLPPPPEPEAGSPCARALACCRAYVGAVPDVVEQSACAGVFEALELEAPDVRCDGMREGWRQALAHLEDEDPESCR